ncbi:MAG: DEAD/DEAH box helicase [Ignavibacteria bacterium]
MKHRTAITMPKDMDNTSPLYQAMKRRSVSSGSKRETPLQLYFQINVDEHGAYLRIIDDSRRDIEPDPRGYSGPVRDILQLIDAIKLRTAFQIDWEKPSGRLYLADNETVLWQLRNCPNVVDAAMRPIQFADNDQLGKVIITIQDAEPQLETTFAVEYNHEIISPIMAITETCVYAQGTLIDIKSLGGKPQSLRLFQTFVFPHELEKYLSLLMSTYPGISIRYDNFIVEEGEPITTQQCVFIEKIDADNTLYLRMSQSIPETEPTLIEEFDIQRYVSVNPAEKRMLISRILDKDIAPLVEGLSKKLSQIKKLARTSSDFIVDGTLFIIQEELAREFIRKELEHIVQNFVVYGSENLKTYRIKSVTPTLSVSLSHGIDFLEGDVGVVIDEEHFTVFDALAMFKNHGYVQLSDGTQALPNAEFMRKLERIFHKSKKKTRISFFDLPIIEELLDENAAEKAFPKARSIFRGFSTYQDRDIHIPSLNTELRNYQELGFKWMRYLHDNRLGGCLADDMGLGKTLQTIALLASLYPGEKKQSLIIMPKSLLFNWEQEIKKFAPQISTYTYYGGDRDWDLAIKSDVILTTYSVLRNDIEALREKEFHMVVLDESQNIKNLNSRTARSALLLRSECRFALSGTPIENNIGELYALFRFLNPSMFGGPDEFTRMYATPIQRENSKEIASELRRKIFPFILRRLKKEVAKELPDRIEQTIFIEMSPEQMSYYEQRRNFYYQTIREEIQAEGLQKSQFHILQALSDLRQIASCPEVKTEGTIISPKREVLMEHVVDAVANGHKILIFSNYIGAVSTIEEELTKEGIGHVVMTGSSTNRQSIVEKFQKDDSIRAFVMTLKTGGLGLNLTAADMIFLYDPWWNIAAENQAIDRSHRIGQANTVLSYKLIARGSIEEKILKLQDRKRELFDAIISTDGASLKALTEEDIEYILGDGETNDHTR